MRPVVRFQPEDRGSFRDPISYDDERDYAFSRIKAPGSVTTPLVPLHEPPLEWPVVRYWRSYVLPEYIRGSSWYLLQILKRCWPQPMVRDLFTGPPMFDLIRYKKPNEPRSTRALRRR